MKRVHDAIGWWNRLLTLWRRGRRARDIDEEIAFHLAMRQAEHERDGLAPELARLTAARQFGNVTALKEQTRDMWTFPSFESLVQDLRYALRTLRRAPGFALIAVLVLAIGIGATTAMFSLVDAMLVRGLPYAQADRLVLLIGNVQRAGGVERRGNSYPDHVDWRARHELRGHGGVFDADRDAAGHRRTRAGCWRGGLGALLFTPRGVAGARPRVHA